MKKSKLTMGLLAVLVLTSGATVFPGGNTAQAADEPDLPQETQVVHSLEHAVTLEEAVVAANLSGLKPVAYQYENPAVVGEYAPLGDESVDEFLARFRNDFATEPQVTAIVTREATASLTGRQKAATVDVEVPEFVAAPAKLSPAMEEQLSAPEPRPLTGARAAAAPIDWRPSGADVSVRRTSGAKPISIVQGYFWTGGSRPNMTPPGFGMEFEVNMYNGASASETITRPACSSGYKSAFAAQNQNWSWRLVGGNGTVPSLSKLGAYADYNDTSDPCNRNSMAIGVRYPGSIPVGNGDYGLYAIIDAPAGTVAKSSIRGVVQAVSDQVCSKSPVSLSLTDCMGVTAGNWGSSTPQNRITLGAGRNATAPNYCWISEGKGLAGSYFEKTC